MERSERMAGLGRRLRRISGFSGLLEDTTTCRYEAHSLWFLRIIARISQDAPRCMICLTMSETKRNCHVVGWYNNNWHAARRWRVAHVLWNGLVMRIASQNAPTYHLNDIADLMNRSSPPLGVGKVANVTERGP